MRMQESAVIVVCLTCTLASYRMKRNRKIYLRPTTREYYKRGQCLVLQRSNRAQQTFQNGT